MTKTTRRFAIGAGMLLGVGVVFLAEEHIRGALELHAWQRAMRTKREKLTIAELTPALTNIAGRVVTPGEAVSLLGCAPAPMNCPTVMHTVAPGKARVAWKQSNWRELKASSWNDPALVSAFKSLRESMPALRNSLTNHAFVVSLDYNQGFGLRLLHLAPAKSALQALCAETVFALHEQRLDEATENLVAGAALIRLLKEERTPLSQLVRISATTGLLGLQGATWEALQAEGWTDVQLSAIQTGWESLEFVQGMVGALEMERAMECTYFDRHRYSNRELIKILQELGQFAGLSDGADEAPSNLVMKLVNGLDEVSRPVRAAVYIELWRVAWADQDQFCYCEAVQQAINLERKAIAERKWPSVHSADPTADDDQPLNVIQMPSLNAYNRLRYLFSPTTLHAFGTTLPKAIRPETVREMTLAAIALKRYQLRHGRLPENLAALVPEFLHEVPRDWFNGGVLHYRPQAEGMFLLYSVGEDGKDDGGDPRLVNGSRFTRDLVWPMPATPEEVRAAEAREH